MPRKNKRKEKIRSQWTDIDLKTALKKVTNEKIPLSRASKMCGIPRRTLRDYIAKNDFQKRSMGRKPVLNAQQEEELVQSICRLCTLGYQLTGNDICSAVYKYCEVHNIKTPFNKEKSSAGKDWLYGFLKRHREV